MDALSASGELMLVSPRRKRSPEDLSPDKRRRVTPSPEHRLPKTLLVISPASSIQPQPLYAPPNLFPGCETTIELQRPVQISEHGHPSTIPRDSLSPVATSPFPRQIILPFDLRQTPSKFFEQDSSKLLYEILPGTQRVDFDERVLVYHLAQLPEKPWPKKIAGIPCYFTADPNDQGPIIPIRYRSRSTIAVSPNLDLRDNEACIGLVFDLVRDFFLKTDISITEIQYWGRVIIIVLENEVEKDKILQAVPRSVARCKCFYLFESMMARPCKPSARRIKQASSTEIDNSWYDILRPGIMLSSGKHPEDGSEFLSSSGVLVKDRLGFEFMTVAAHGFPGHPFDGMVHHPQGPDIAVGEVIHELTYTDIALVGLKQGVEFINEPFENTIVPTPPSQLKGFARAAETRIGDDVFLDSPFSGYVEGTVGSHSLLRCPIDDELEPVQTWIRCRWDYMGQDSNTIMADGVCGSAIWGEDRRVLGFFRYAPTSGTFLDWCMSVSADHLLDKGYTMVVRE